jgi:hypothetical protein
VSTKEIQQKLVETMEDWQKIENASVAGTGVIIDKTKNPVIKMIMEIIQADSRMHHKVQAFIAEITAKTPVELNIEDLTEVWDAIEEHIELEKKMVSYVEETLEAIKGRKMLIQEYLLRYLHADEQKHDQLLAAMESVKRGAYPYG